MYKAYKFRLYLNKEQEIIVCKTFGCTRFIYNYFLNKIKENKKYIKTYDMCKEIKELVIIYPWLKEVDSCALRNAVFNLEDSFKNYYSKRSKYPNFKNRNSKQRYRTSFIESEYKGHKYENIKVDLKRRIITLPKLKEVKIRGYRNIKEIKGKIVNATIEKELTGKYYVSVIYKQEETITSKRKAESIVGIDVGIKTLITLSDGTKYDNKKIINKYEKRIKKLQRKISRQEKNSKKYIDTKQRLAVLHNKIKNGRRYYIIKVTNEITKKYDIIVSEKLKISKMLKNAKISKSLSDASINKIFERIRWKANVLGKYYYQIDTYYPSSKTCSHCGNETEITNNLNIRKWECIKCHMINDRDINASINIMFEGLKMHYIR